MLCSVALVAAMLPADAPASTTGLPVAVDQDALHLREGESRTLVVGADIHVGDTIRTGETGSAQLLFTDETRMVVGPNSTLFIDSVLFRSDGKAENFAVSVTRGAFRFATGQSDSSAYSVRTPTATLGVRGTEFDLYVDEERRTWLALMDGEVTMCSPGVWPTCIVVRGTCSIVSVDDERKLSAPSSREEVGSVVRQWFTYIVSQDPLREDFHTDTGVCETNPQLVQLPSLEEPDWSALLPEDGTAISLPPELLELLFPNTPGGSSSGPVIRDARLAPSFQPLMSTGFGTTRSATFDEPGFLPDPQEGPGPEVAEPSVSAIIPLPAGVWLFLSGLGILGAAAGLRGRRRG